MNPLFFASLLVFVYILVSISYAQCFRFSERARTATLQDLLSGCRSGDILVFSARDYDAAAVRSWSWSRFSHCGMVVVADPHPPLLWHATCDSSVDVVTGTKMRGCKLSDLEQYVLKTDADILWCRPCGEGGFDPWPAVSAFHGREFDHSYVNLLRTAHSPLGGLARALFDWQPGPNMFCSGLVERTLVGGGGDYCSHPEDWITTP